MSGIGHKRPRPSTSSSTLPKEKALAKRSRVAPVVLVPQPQEGVFGSLRQSAVGRYIGRLFGLSSGTPPISSASPSSDDSDFFEIISPPTSPPIPSLSTPAASDSHRISIDWEDYPNPSPYNTNPSGPHSRLTRPPPRRPDRDDFGVNPSQNPFAWGMTIRQNNQKNERELSVLAGSSQKEKYEELLRRTFAGAPGMGRRAAAKSQLGSSRSGLQTVLSNDQANKSFDGLVSPKPQTDGYKPMERRAIGSSAKEKASKGSGFDLSRMSSALNDLKVSQSEKEKKIRPPKPVLPSKLTPEQEAAVVANLRNPAFKSANVAADVTTDSIRRLKPGTWLDDEVMNWYCGQMTERAKEVGKRKVHFLNSFFYGKLSEMGYTKGRLRRWTKKVDIFGLDVLVFPINQGNMHWTACAINFAKKRIEYYDSMGDYGKHREDVFYHVREYLEEEHKDKKGKPMDFDGWQDYFNPKAPQQDNGADCGVFSCQTLESVARGRDLAGEGFEFSHKDMPFFRRLMIWEIGQKKLEDRVWGSPEK
ncbi:hypothetical protein IAT38_005087 [Cryptococcus sp. DSM 104549]